jgi:hypothetical protein
MEVACIESAAGALSISEWPCIVLLIEFYAIAIAIALLVLPT